MTTLLKMMLPIVADSFNDMYYRGGVLVGEEIRANKGEVISFDTYFNSFCQGSYKSHTVVENIKITINLKGSFCVQLMHAKGTFLRNKAENEQVMPYIEDAVDVQETVLQQHNFESSTPTELCFEQSLASIKEGGITYLKLISKQDGSTCHGFTIASKQPPKQAVKLAIVICTYKREQYVYNNINRLKSSPYWGDFGVIVVDNGQTLCDIDGVNIVKNANTGGSGGFTRGMLEAEQNGFTHFLLMDDDIEFCDETVQRTKRFMEYAKDADRLTLGASMLVMGKGYLQYEKGAEWHGRGLSTSERGYDLRQNKAVIVNDNYINQKDYTAWWYCCMSTKTLARIGKPLPFFIKGDDIEYGLRAQNTVLVNNGIGVWHESFESKYSGVLSYYIRRNEMILNSIHLQGRSVLAVIKDVVQAVGKQVVYHRYKTLQLVKIAVEDFLQGADHFLSTDAEANHKKLAPLSEKLLAKSELTAMGLDIDNMDYHQGNASIIKSALTLNGYLIPQFMYPKKAKQYKKVHMMKAPISSMFMATKTVHYNEQSEQGFITELKKGELIKCGLWLIKISIKLLFCYSKLKKDYQTKLTKGTKRD